MNSQEEECTALVDGARQEVRHGSRINLHPFQVIAICIGAMVIGAYFATEFARLPVSDPLLAKPESQISQVTDSYLQESLRKRSVPQKTTPSLAWLMSFPNSGTTYTLNLVSAVSDLAVASNYGRAEENLVFPGGPYWIDPTTAKPSGTVLTKTHCGGFCHKCEDPRSWSETPHSFMMHCASALASSPDQSPYDYRGMVDRAVHLIRNPFDNLVSRFHFGAYKANVKHSPADLDRNETFSFTREGFLNFCNDHTSEIDEQMSKRIDQEVLSIVEDVPCHMDLFRYVQWHNLAFMTTDDLMQIPTQIIHYEDYNMQFNETLATLLNFLDLPNVNEAPEFKTGKSYRDDYFTSLQIMAIRNATRKLASPKTWEYLERYF